MILSGLFFSILRCVDFRECSRTTSTLRFAKINAPCLEKNILTQKPSFDLVCSRITNTFSFTKNTVPLLGKNILAVVVLRQVFLFFKLYFPLRLDNCSCIVLPTAIHGLVCGSASLLNLSFQRSRYV
jgi:hypothetical protein